MLRKEIGSLNTMVEKLSRVRLDDINAFYECVNNEYAGKVIEFTTDWTPSKSYIENNVRYGNDASSIKEVEGLKVVTRKYNDDGLLVCSTTKCKPKWDPEAYSFNDIIEYQYDESNRLIKRVKQRSKSEVSNFVQTTEIEYSKDMIKIIFESNTTEYDYNDKTLLLSESSRIQYFNVRTVVNGNTEVIYVQCNNRSFLDQYIVDGKITRLVDHQEGETHYFTEK